MFPSRRTKASGLATGGGDVFRDEYSLEFDGSNDRLNFGDVTSFDGLDDMTKILIIKYLYQKEIIILLEIVFNLI